MWDWPGDVRRMRFAGPSDEALPHQIFEPNGQYWGHKYTRVLVQVSYLRLDTRPWSSRRLKSALTPTISGRTSAGNVG